MTITLTGAWLVVTALVAVSSAIILLLSRRKKDLDNLAKEHTDELTQLAETRKEIIAELRQDMADKDREYRAEIEALRREVAEIRGAYQALENFKAQEIARLAAQEVLKGLGVLDDQEYLDTEKG